MDNLQKKKIHSMPITIPYKKNPLDTVTKTYETYTYSIPEYGSFDSPNELNINKNKIPLKCSESSHFPNHPFGKSPPNEKYNKSMYLNYIADNNLRRNMV
jgi:hypothetical protein